jgi:uncharacterized protein (DUF1501 family)
MKRRGFLKNIGLISGAGAISFSISGIPVNAFARPFLNINSLNGKILVLLQLKGGNDGLNTVIPYEDGIYFNKRPNIGIPKDSVVKLNTLTGLHTSLQPLKQLFDNGKLALIQNVGYANQNRSHFRSTDIWLSASDSNQFLYDGWAGRYLAKAFPDYPLLPPEFPMAIQLGSVQSLVLESQHGGMGVTFQDPNNFYQLVSGITADNDPTPSTLAGDELKFLKEIAALSIQYASIIKAKADAGQNKVTYPNTNLGTQLAIIADLISGGLQTPVYMATLDGFDTHANQANTHSNLLKTFADAVKAFQDDLQLMGVADKVVTFTFSEFGRRLTENGSLGTDHGAAAPMFVIGNPVQGGIVGSNPSLTDLDNSGDVKFKYDYRQIYTTLLTDHLGMEKQKVTEILLKDFQTLPLINNSPTGVENNIIPNEYELKQNYPNPFNPETQITFTLGKSSNVKIKIFDMLGREVATILNEYKNTGNHSVKFYANGLASGTYIYSIEADNFRESKKMVLMK